MKKTIMIAATLLIGAAASAHSLSRPDTALDVVAQAKPVTPSTPDKPDSKVLERANRFYAELDKGKGGAAASGFAFGFSGLPGIPGIDLNKPVDLDIDNAPMPEAVQQVLKASGLAATPAIDADVPADVRVTVKAKGVRFQTAMDLVTQAAGAGWRLERKNNATTLRVGRSVRGFGVLLSPRGFAGAAAAASAMPGAANPYLLDINPFTVREKQVRFTCPHCKGTTTMIQVEEQAQCPRCSRAFQPGWQFCPTDGTKRPASRSEWQYCPMCGKRVDVQKSDESGDPHVEIFARQGWAPMPPVTPVSPAPPVPPVFGYGASRPVPPAPPAPPAPSAPPARPALPAPPAPFAGTEAP